VAELPSVQKAHEQFRDKDVVFLAISIDGMGARAVEPVMTAHGYTFASLIDRGMEVARRYGVRAVPTTYVIDRQGLIVAAGYGPLDVASAEFAQFLEGLLSTS
jgi:peroxiredoxin